MAILLLMPLAQTAASWHLLSHFHGQRSGHSDEPTAAYTDYCDLCQTAAATLGGLNSSPSAQRPSAVGPVDIPRFNASTTVVKQPWQPYASRAPPFALN